MPQSKKSLVIIRCLKVLGISAFSFIALLILLYALLWLMNPLLINKNEQTLFSYVDSQCTIKGEPVNILILSDSFNLSLLEEKGWESTPPLGREGIDKMVNGLAGGVTPISPRYIINREGNKAVCRMQDFSLQGPNGGIEERHHIRLWKSRVNGRKAFYAAASYDAGLGITFSGLLPVPTHIISPDIDSERDFTGRQISSYYGLSMRYTISLPPILYMGNGDNSWYYTDGLRLIVDSAGGKEGSSIYKEIITLRRDYFRFLTSLLHLMGVV